VPAVLIRPIDGWPVSLPMLVNQSAPSGPALIASGWSMLGSAKVVMTPPGFGPAMLGAGTATARPTPTTAAAMQARVLR